MGQMSNEDASRILDPETRREALAPYAHDCQLRLAVTEEACTVAAKVLRQTAWISVEDRLPADERPVLTFIGYRNTGIGFITTSSYFCFDPAPHWQWDGLVRDDQRVLFWLPLPEPPAFGGVCSLKEGDA